MRYIVGMNQQDAKAILRRIETWPEEDQAELAELAREIESRRAGVYVLTDEEKAAIEDARRSGFASEEQMAAFWKRHGIE
jgi:cell division protein FtsB